jgi:hypothetical protein
LKRWLKIILILLTILILVLVGLRIYVNVALKQVLFDQVNTISKSNYSLKIRDIKIDILAFNARIEGFELKHNPSNNSKESLYANISAKTIRFRGLSLFQLLFNKSIKLNNLELISPEIEIYLDSLAQGSKPSLENLFTLKIKRLKLLDVKIKVFNGIDNISTLNANAIVYEISKLQLSIKELNLMNTNAGQIASVQLNKADINGFNLNTLLNERYFKYNSANLGFLKLGILNSEKAEKFEINSTSLHKQGQSNFFIRFKPLKIQQFQLIYTKGKQKLSIRTKEFEYNNSNFMLNSMSGNFSGEQNISLSSKTIKINGFDADSIASGYAVNIKQITLIQPKIKAEFESDSKLIKDNKSYDSSLADLFYIKRIKSLIINKGNIETFAKNNSWRTVINNIYLQASNILPPNQRNNKLSFEKLGLKTGQMYMNTATNLYRVSANSISYSQQAGTFYISNFKVTPNYNKQTFPSKMGKQVAMLTLSVSQIAGKKFDIRTILAENKFKCAEITLSSGQASFYKDKNIPLKPTDYRPFPQELLREAPFKINIGKFVVKQSNIRIEIKSPGNQTTGNFEIDQVNMSIENIDNTNLSTNNYATLNFSGRLAKTGIINAKARLNINDKNNSYSAQVSIGKMPFNKLNSMIQTGIPVEISNGEIEKANILLTGSSLITKSRLELTYNNLSMKFLTGANAIGNDYVSNMGSKLANYILINDNPSSGRKLRVSEESIKPPRNKFILNHWMAATTQAMISTVMPKAANYLKGKKR